MRGEWFPGGLRWRQTAIKSSQCHSVPLAYHRPSPIAHRPSPIAAKGLVALVI